MPILVKNRTFWVILVGYSPCILVKNDAFWLILVDYSPCIFVKNVLDHFGEL